MMVHSINLLAQWMAGTGVCGNIVKMVQDYLLAQNTRSMVSYIPHNTPDLTLIVTSQDVLG